MTDSQSAAATADRAPGGPRREILIVLPGLLLTLIIAMLDQLVVSTALPRIVGDLGGLRACGQPGQSIDPTLAQLYGLRPQNSDPRSRLPDRR